MKNVHSFNVKKVHISSILGIEKDNPRNSEGAFIRLDDGRIAFVYSRYCGDNGSDDAACNISVVYSEDNGDSFDVENPETLVYAKDYKEQNVMSVSLLRMQNGDIGLFFLLKHSDMSNEYILCRFDGMLKEKLGEVSCFSDGYSAYYVVNNDRVIRHSDGRLIIPAAMHDRLGDIHRFNPNAKTVFFVSEDDANSWKMQTACLVMNDPYTGTGLQEPGMVELPGGVLYCYMRTDRMLQYESMSIDGKHWTAVTPSKFSSPASPMLIKRNPFNGKYYAVWNPIPEYQTRKHTSAGLGRTPLVIAESADGVNFSDPVVVEDDPERGYCYPAMEFLDEKTVLLAYCSGGPEEGCCLFRTSICKVTLE